MTRGPGLQQAIPGVLRELFVGRLNPPLPWPRVAIYATAVTLVIASMKAPPFMPPHLTEDGHGMASLSVAVNRSFCGVPSGLSKDAQIGRIFFEEPGTNQQPVRQVITARWGSLERYCATVTTPFVNNENSLMLVESWAWDVAPNLSLRGIGRVLLAVKLGLLLFCCLVFLRIGVGVVLCYAILDAAVAVLGRLQPDFGYSTYSFLVCAVIASVALYPLMFILPSRSRARQIAWPLIAGVWSAFVVNMRTSYLPVCAGLALLYACAVMLESDGSAGGFTRRLRRVAPMVLSFAVGYAVFQYSFIVRSRGAGTELSYHTLFHPLVLSVGVPMNAFSQREGITWNDDAGLVLAHRVDPSARYLTKEYERALATYYFRLWRRYPVEMSRVYLEKAHVAGTEMIAGEDVPAWPVTFARRVLRGVASGPRLLLLLLAFTAVAAWQYIRRKAAILLLMTMMGMTATMLMIESIVIVPRYYLTYHASLLLLCCSVTLVLVQVAFNGIVRLVPFVAADRARR